MSPSADPARDHPPPGSSSTPAPPSTEHSAAAARARKGVLRQALSIGVASGAYGVSFGALSVAAGLSLAQTMALSLLMFTGGSQFAFVSVLGAGGTGIAATATAGLLGLRNGFYGLQLAPTLGAHGWRRPAAAHLTIDESTAVALVQPQLPLRRYGFWATGLSVLVLWNLATLLGAVIGDALGDPRRWGLDAAAAGAFLALLWPRLNARLPRSLALATGVLAALLVTVAPAGVPVLAGAVVALAAAPWDRS